MSIEQEIAALDGLSTPELAGRYAELRGKPPRTRHRRWLQRRVAHLLQERALGGLSVAARRRLDALAAELELPFDRPEEAPRRGGNGALSPGTTLVREWRGQAIRVAVLEGSFEWDGRRFGSLTAVAMAITGQHMSGPRFFAVAKPGRPS
jgi:hypothetical protein